MQPVQKTSSQACTQLYHMVFFKTRLVLGSDISEIQGRQPSMAAQPEHDMLWKTDCLQLLLYSGGGYLEGLKSGESSGEGNLFSTFSHFELVYEMARASRYIPSLAGDKESMGIAVLGSLGLLLIPSHCFRAARGAGWPC